MLTLKKVAVTGGLASGKTSVCHVLESCGAYVISADQIVHQLGEHAHIAIDGLATALHVLGR